MRDLNDKIDGVSTFIAPDWNEVTSELQNVIEGLGITLSGADLNQFGKALAGYCANSNFYIDSGAANAYVLNQVGSKQPLPNYIDGAEFEFVAANDNAAGASTINVAGLGAKSITTRAGNNPAAGEISGRVVVRYDLATDQCKLLNIVKPADTVANHIRVGNMQLWDGSSGRSRFDVDLNLAINTFESIGPTGSGADNIWTDLDVVPANASILLVQLHIDPTSTTTAVGEQNIWVASNDVVSPPSDSANKEGMAYFGGVATSVSGTWAGTMHIPIDDTAIFKVRYDAVNVVNDNIGLIYKGFIAE